MQVLQADPPLLEDLPPLITSPGEEPSQRTLKLELRSSGNKDQDKRRLQRFLGFMHSYPGQDHFTLLLVENGHRYILDFPNDTTGIWEELLRRLGEIVGAHKVSVERE
jgi:DNA polymerase III subunit alpha